MTMNVPLKPTDCDNLEAQPVVFATRTAAGASGLYHNWVPNVAYMVAGAAIFFLGAMCTLLAAPHPHTAAGGAGAGALASTRKTVVTMPSKGISPIISPIISPLVPQGKFPWSGGSQEWDAMSHGEQSVWCLDSTDKYTPRQQLEYDAHCDIFMIP